MVLVTGGSGLVGSELISQLLLQGKQVIALYNKTPLPNFQSKNIQQIQCNVLDVVGLQAAMVGVEQVYHCAAIVSFNPKQKNELFAINIEGTANVVNAAIITGVKKMVHISSVAALGWLREGEEINESMSWTEESNSSNYSKSKYLSELEVWRGIGEGLDAVIVNPTIILGAGNWEGGSSQIFKTVYEGIPWYSIGSTGFVDVRDVAKAMIQLMDSSISGERFILNGSNQTYKNVFMLIADAFGKKRPYKKVTPLVAKIVWRIEAIKSRFTKKQPLITKETAAAALAMARFDNSKLIKFLPNFTYTPIEETIQFVCANFIKKIK